MIHQLLSVFSLWFGITPPRPEQEKKVFFILVGVFTAMFSLMVAFGFFVLYLIGRR